MNEVTKFESSKPHFHGQIAIWKKSGHNHPPLSCYKWYWKNNSNNNRGHKVLIVREHLSSPNIILCWHRVSDKNDAFIIFTSRWPYQILFLYQRLNQAKRQNNGTVATVAKSSQLNIFSKNTLDCIQVGLIIEKNKRVCVCIFIISRPLIIIACVFERYNPFSLLLLIILMPMWGGLIMMTDLNKLSGIRHKHKVKPFKLARDCSENPC